MPDVITLQGGPPHTATTAPVPAVKHGFQGQQGTVPSKGAADQPGVAVSAGGGSASQRQKQCRPLRHIACLGVFLSIQGVTLKGACALPGLFA